MYLHLSKQRIVQIGYELGYLFGTLIKERRCILDLRADPKILLKYNSKLLDALEFLHTDKIEIIDRSDEKSIVISDDLFYLTCELNSYAQNKLFHSSILFASESCASGFRDVFKTGITISSDDRLFKFIEKIVWYWFEEKLSFGIYRSDTGRDMYFFKVVNPEYHEQIEHHRKFIGGD